MKRNIIRNLFVSAVAMTFAAPLLSSAATPSPSPTATPALAQRMQQLDRQLDSIFADTFRGFGDTFSGSAFASSIDLRDQKDKYVVRVYVPDANTSKVNAQVEGSTLHVTATGEENTNNSSASERYEQVISLPGPVLSDKMQIERKQNLVVVTLPKGPGATAAASPAARAATSPSDGELAGVDQNIVQQMARMQRQMNRIFDDAFADDDEADAVPDFSQKAPFGSAVHVDDLKDKYVVHFNLPDKNLEDVNVQLENGELHLTASQSKKDQSQNTSEFASDTYEQRMTLPGPVQEKGLKVERQNGTIVVTVPKANE